MKRATITGAGLAALLALTGCGGGNDQERIAELEAQVDSLEQELDAQSQTGMPFDIPDEFNSRMTGPVEASVGDPVEVDLGIFEGENNYAATVTLSEVEFTETCVSDSRDGTTETSEVGQFAYLTFDVEVDADAEDSFDFNQNAMRWNDYRYHLVSIEAMVCEEDLGFQDPIEPGESAQMTLVLEVPDTEADFVWQEPTHDVTWSISGNEGESDASSASLDGTGGQSAPDTSGAEEVEQGGVGEPQSSTSFDSCEEADFHWGGLMNDDLDGLDIDDQELAETEAWMQENGCW